MIRFTKAFSARSVAALICSTMVVSLATQKVWAWGKTGHEAVAMVAEGALDAKTKAKVNKILQDMSMVDASTWPDKVKHTGPWNHSGPYHFADMNDSQTYLDMIDELPAKARKSGDVIRALAKAEDVLRDSSSSADQKRYSLSFMIHLIGDLHQPLHEGRPEDRGGNDIDVTYFGVKTNLHSVWDTYIIENILNALNVASSQSLLSTGKKRVVAKDDTEAYVEQLRTPKDSEISDWQDSYLLDWSTDSIENRTEIYKGLKGTTSSGYQKKYGDYVGEKVLRAGYRLAAWLTAIVAGDDYQAEKSADLRNKLSQKLGSDYADAVSLEPNSKGSQLTAAEIHAFDCDDD